MDLPSNFSLSVSEMFFYEFKPVLSPNLKQMVITNVLVVITSDPHLHQ